MAKLVEESPSLRDFVEKEVLDIYRAGRLRAADETGIAFGLFPAECPFTSEQVLNLDCFPEDRSIE